MVGDCGTKRAVTPRKPRSPLNRATLNELALTYVGRFATTRLKLSRYLNRKVRERGWEGAGPPPIDDIADRCVRSGYIDDSAFALSKARSLTGRGYGIARVRQTLRADGVGEEDSLPAHEYAANEAVGAALRLAKRKRIGPYSPLPMDKEGREKALAAMIRGGHKFSLAKAILAIAPGEEPDLQALAEAAGRHVH